MKNPFNYLQFATGDYFYNRREILADLHSRFVSGQTNVVLYGPRRYGKSSLVSELASLLEMKGFICLTFDMVKMPTLDIFINAYAKKIYKQLAPLRSNVNHITQFFKYLRPVFSLAPDGEMGLSFNTAEKEMGPEELSEVLDLPQRLAGDKRILIILDEFQEVKDILPNDGFERVMRSVIQTHANVSYIFLGSRYHMLRRMFTDHNRPFYKSAIPMLLDRPPEEESVAFVMSRFESAGCSVSPEVARSLVAKIDNIPYYIQQLGFETFRLVDDAGRTVATAEDVERAYANLSGFNRDQYEQLMLSLSATQKKLLLAISQEEVERFDADYRTRHALGTSSTLNSAKQKLIEDGHLEQIGGACRISDPFFAEYLRN